MIKPDVRSTKGDWRGAVVVCREHGWGVGTRLVGDEGYGPTEIVITAIGNQTLLARAIPNGTESPWTLSCRDWREVQP